jgi:hypothetical protein
MWHCTPNAMPRFEGEAIIVQLRPYGEPAFNEAFEVVIRQVTPFAVPTMSRTLPLVVKVSPDADSVHTADDVLSALFHTLRR